MPPNGSAFFSIGGSGVTARKCTPDPPLRYSGSFPRPRRPAEALRPAAFEPERNGLENRRPSGPGACEPARLPRPKARCAPRSGPCDRSLSEEGEDQQHDADGDDGSDEHAGTSDRSTIS